MGTTLAIIGLAIQILGTVPGLISSIRPILRERREDHDRRTQQADAGAPAVAVDPEVRKRVLAHRAPLSLFCAFVAELVVLALIWLGPDRGQGPVPPIDWVVVGVVGVLVLVGGGFGVEKAWSARNDGWRTWRNPVIGVGVAGVAWFSALIITAPLW